MDMTSGEQLARVIEKQAARIKDFEREVETLRRLAREDKEARLKALGEVSGH